MKKIWTVRPVQTNAKTLAICFLLFLSFPTDILAASLQTPEFKWGAIAMGLLGGMAFILSDSLLAINKFRFPVPAERYVVIITYYFAQYMIAHAFLQNE